ncbi:MAG: serine/threonine protein phosphatase 1 [Paracoccaceae bacterium]|jgi:serine/threonine protein phosphatase 1
MFASLRNLFRGTTSAGPAVSAAVQRAKLDRPLPGVDTYVVGDVHGRADLLERVLEAIDADIGQIRARNPQLVFVGDYIDRGPDSAAVLRRMLELSTELPNNVTCLLGNHERMMLDFLVDPVSRGPRWLRSGGTSTLESFGLHTGALDLGSSADTFLSINAALKTQMGPEMISWLKIRPLIWNSGNLWVVHAAADPQHAMDDQSPRILLWGHPEFRSRRRSDEMWVAHGHTIVSAPLATDGCISVDTGAYQTGILTACAVRPNGDVKFLTS